MAQRLKDQEEAVKKNELTYDEDDQEFHYIVINELMTAIRQFFEFHQAFAQHTAKQPKLKEEEEVDEGISMDDFKAKVAVLGTRVRDIIANIQRYIFREITTRLTMQSFSEKNGRKMKQALQMISFAWPVMDLLPTSNVDRADGHFKHKEITFPSLQELIMYILSGCVEQRFLDVYGLKDEGNDDSFSIDGFSCAVESDDEDDADEKGDGNASLLDSMRQINCDMALFEEYCEIDLLTKQFTNLYHLHVIPILDDHMKLKSSGQSIQVIQSLQRYQHHMMQLIDSLEEATEKCADVDLYIDVYMDLYEKQCKSKIIQWVSNILNSEKDSEPFKSKDDDLYYTNAATDLFTNINTAFSVAKDSHHLKGDRKSVV